MKRNRNVNGAAPGAPTFEQMYPKGSPAREVVEAKIKSISGQDFLSVCREFEMEQAAAKRAETEAIAAKKKAAFEATQKQQQKL